MHTKETFQALFHVLFRFHLKTVVNTSIHAVSHNSPNYSIRDILLHLPTTKATYCLAAEEESVGSIKRQVSLKQEYQHQNGQM